MLKSVLASRQLNCIESAQDLSGERKMYSVRRQIGLLVLIWLSTWQVHAAVAADHQTLTNGPTPCLRGVWEMELVAGETVANPLTAAPPQIIFLRPDQSEVRVDCFLRDNRTWVGRAYCDQTGTWSWRSTADEVQLINPAGTFEVQPSGLPGKLRKHPLDPYQFCFDSGQWFLHIGDTGYRFLTDTEPLWQQYIDEAAEVGFTKIRTWFCRSRGGVEALLNPDRSGPDFDYWNEMDRRIAYALQKYPHIQLQLIPYGEDADELNRYGDGDPASQWIARHAQARFSAYPNIQWCISNDQHISPMPGKRVVAPDVINRIGRDMQAREPWRSLITNHQRRFSGYAFVESEWSDIVTLEDLDQVTGAILLKYRKLFSHPVINDEDRYGIYRSPLHDRYFFRRLMWASLLSGGHATYGGIESYEPFAGPDGTKGMHGYLTSVKDGRLDDGARDFNWIHAFFRDSRLTLVGFEPADELAGGNSLLAKAASDGKNMIVYLPNPDSETPEKANVNEAPAVIDLTPPAGKYRMRWFDPQTGNWHDSGPQSEIHGGSSHSLTAPFAGDAVLLLQLSV